MTTSFQRNRLDLLKLLCKHAYKEQDVILASGERSNFYIDCRQVSLMPEGMLLIGYLMYVIIRKNALDTVAVGGPSIGADPLVCAIAAQSMYGDSPRLNAFLVRKEPKKHGLSKWLEGPYVPPGSPVVLVEDVVTSGGSLLKAIEIAEDEGLKVRHLITLVNRSGITELKGIPLTSIYTLSDFQP